MVVPQPKPFQFADFIAVLRKRWWLCGLTTAAAIVLAAYLVMNQTPQYVASAEILMGGQGNVDRSTADLIEAPALSNSVIQGELAILKSSALLVRVVRRLDLANDPEFNPALRPPVEPVPYVDEAKALIKRLLVPPSPDPEQTAPAAELSSAMAEASSAHEDMLGGLGPSVQALRRKMDVRQRGSSFVVAVTINSADRMKAAGIANTIVDEYIAFVTDKRFQAAQRFTTWLEKRVDELAASVEESETAVIAFRAIADSEVDSSARIEQQMQEMTTKLVDARATLAETEARLGKARALLDSDGPMAAMTLLTSPTLDAYNTQLASLRQDRAEAAERFNPNSERLDAIRRDIESVEAEIALEVARLIAEMENSADVLRINVGALRDSLHDLEQVVLARSKEEIKLNQLEREADANRRLYEDFLGRFKESSEIQNLRHSDAEVISYASPPGAPATPRKKQAVVLATAAGLAFGIGLAFLLELLPKRVVSPDQVTRTTGLGVFGHLPKLPGGVSARRLARRMRNRRMRNSAHDMLRNMELILGRNVRSALVASDRSGGDKTTVAMMIAWAAVQQGKSCLLIDADLRKNELSRRFGSVGGPGLLDVLYERLPIEKAIHHDSNLDVDVLPTTRSSVDPDMLFSTNRAEDVFQELGDRFDIIVIDAPPVEAESDSPRFSNQKLAQRTGIDVSLYTVRSNKTQLRTLLDRMPAFGKMKIRQFGAVVTGLRSGGPQQYHQPPPHSAPSAPESPRPSSTAAE